MAKRSAVTPRNVKKSRLCDSDGTNSRGCRIPGAGKRGVAGYPIALLYYEMGKTVLGFNQFQHVEMTQVAETTQQMRADLKNLNGVEYKNHRVYCRAIG